MSGMHFPSLLLFPSSRIFLSPSLLIFIPCLPFPPFLISLLVSRNERKGKVPTDAGLTLRNIIVFGIFRSESQEQAHARTHPSGYSLSLVCSLVHPVTPSTCSIIHSLTRLRTYSLRHRLFNSCIHALARLFIYSLTLSRTNAFIHSRTYYRVELCIYSLTPDSFIHTLILSACFFSAMNLFMYCF